MTASLIGWIGIAIGAAATFCGAITLHSLWFAWDRMLLSRQDKFDAVAIGSLLTAFGVGVFSSGVLLALR